MSYTQGVYLGTHGGIQIKRTIPKSPLFTQLVSNDINTALRRFSFFGSEMVITGDKIKVERVGGNGQLTLVRGQTGPSVERFAFKDMLGGLLLYDRWRDAVNGETDEALELVAPPGAGSFAQDIRVSIEEDNQWNAVAKITDWQFTTNRDVIDVTQLGDQFRHSYEAGLIQGQGSLTCLWDDFQNLCADIDGTPLDNNGRGHPSDGKPRMPVRTEDELANYFLQLCIRVVVGARFKGRFFIKYGGSRSERVKDELAVFYEGDCIATNVSLAFAPDEVVKARINFVTEDKFRLRMMDMQELNVLVKGDGGLDELTTEDGTTLVGRG